MTAGQEERKAARNQRDPNTSITPRKMQTFFNDRGSPKSPTNGGRVYNSYQGSPKMRTYLSPSKSPLLKTAVANAYAGARFSEPPSPHVLPKPPSHWMVPNILEPSDNKCSQMSHQLKLMLKMQA